MIETRAYRGDDRADFLSLYRACLRHYRIPAATPDEEERVCGLLDAGRHMSCLMAYDQGRPAGFATWALTFPAGAGIALYMKEVFVAHAARGNGVGKALLAGLIAIAEAENCVRFDWQTDASNQASQAFYDAIGAPAYDKKTYRIMASDFHTFAQRLRD